MNGKVDWTIVKSILVAWWLNVLISISICLIVVGIIMGIISKENTASYEKKENQKSTCMNAGGCWVNDRCQNPCTGW